MKTGTYRRCLVEMVLCCRQMRVDRLHHARQTGYRCYMLPVRSTAVTHCHSIA